jgi:hypothetical protein
LSRRYATLADIFITPPFAAAELPSEFLFYEFYASDFLFTRATIAAMPRRCRQASEALPR